MRPLRQQVGVQLQESQLPDQLRVREALDLYASFYETPADWNALIDELGLGDHRDKAFGKLSGGQKQRLSIALALVGNPRIAMLDELTTGLDPQARRDTWDLIEGIRDRGVTVLLVTHFMEEAERLADRIAVIDARQGRRPRHARPASSGRSTPSNGCGSGRPQPFADDLLTRPARGPQRRPTPVRGSSSPAPATSSTPSRPCWPATRSWPTTSGSSRRTWTTRSSR